MLPVMTNEEMIVVIQADSNDESIQKIDRFISDAEYVEFKGSNLWDFVRYTYRVKPKPIECWVTYYPTRVGSKFGNVYGSEKEAIKMVTCNGVVLKVVHPGE